MLQVGHCRCHRQCSCSTGVGGWSDCMQDHTLVLGSQEGKEAAAASLGVHRQARLLSARALLTECSVPLSKLCSS